MRGICLLIAFAVNALGTGSVSGTVVDGKTSQPVRKIIVTLTLHGTDMFARERSDADGHFKFDGLPAGQYELGAGGPGELIALAEGESLGGLKVLLARPASISGHVFDEQGGPVGGVTVTIRRPATIEIRRPVITNDQGEYTIHDVEPGRYLLHANGIKAPGTSLAAQDYTGFVNIRPGEQLGDLNFPLRTEETHQIHGRLTGVPEGEDRTVRVVMTAADPGAPPGARAADADPPDWWFSFGEAAPGTYILDARLQRDGKTWAFSRTVDSGMPDESLVLPLVPAVDVTGELQIEGGELSGIEVRLIHSGAGLRESISAKPGAKGQFVLSQVPAGTWRLEMTGLPVPGFIKEARFGDHDVRAVPFRIEPTLDVVLKIVIGVHPGAISGEVSSGEAGVIVVSTSCYSAVTDRQGKFTIANVPPGKYRTLALEKTAPGSFCGEFARLSTAEDEIEVKEGQTLDVRPRLIPVEQVWQ